VQRDHGGTKAVGTTAMRELPLPTLPIFDLSARTSRPGGHFGPATPNPATSPSIRLDWRRIGRAMKEIFARRGSGDSAPSATTPKAPRG
jgi:hypothetical protein